MLRNDGYRSKSRASRGRRTRGSLLAIALAIVMAAPLVAEVYNTVVVKEGDTLWDLADTYLGSGWKFGKFADINTLRSGNPDLIYPGEVLNVPGTTQEPVAEEPSEVEVAVEVLTQMLGDMNSRLADMNADLAGIRADLGGLGSKFGALEDTVVDVQSKAKPPVLDLGAIEQRVTQLDTSVTDLVTTQTEAVKTGQVQTSETVSALQQELEVLAQSVETQAAIQKKALEELNEKVASIGPEEPQEDEEIVNRRHAYGLVGVVAAGLAFLAVSATR